MSNYPPMQPPPPPGQPGGYGQPPAGYPQQPAGYTMPGQAQPQQGNGWALASLITGIAGCIPGVGLIGVILGFVGLSRAKKTQTGKGMAIAGIVIGLLTLVGWGIAGAAGYFGAKAAIEASAPNRDLAKQFVTDLAAGDLTKAAAAVDPTAIDQDDLKRLSGKVTGHGSITDVTTFGLSVKAENKEEVAGTSGVVTFSDGTKRQLNTQQKKVDGAWKIVQAQIENAQ